MANAYAIESGNGNGGLAIVDKNSGALRVTSKPLDLGTGGLFKIAASTGAFTGVAAGGGVFSAHWASSEKFAVVNKINLTWVTTTGFTAAQAVGLEAYVARAFTVSASGGTAIVLTGEEQKLNVKYGHSKFGDMRIATTAALTAGTRTLDGVAIASGLIQELADGATVVKKTFQASFNGNSFVNPIILHQNEGIVVTNKVSMGAAGVATIIVEMEWAEVDVL